MWSRSLVDAGEQGLAVLSSVRSLTWAWVHGWILECERNGQIVFMPRFPRSQPWRAEIQKMMTEAEAVRLLRWTHGNACRVHSGVQAARAVIFTLTLCETGSTGWQGRPIVMTIVIF